MHYNNKITELSKIKLIWNGIDYENPLLIKKYFEKNIDSFIGYIIIKTLENEKYEIGIFSTFWQSGSVIVYTENGTHKKLELRLLKNDQFEIILLIKRPQEQEQILKHRLSPKQTALIPTDLIRSMKTTKDQKMSQIFLNTDFRTNTITPN